MESDTRSVSHTRTCTHKTVGMCVFVCDIHTYIHVYTYEHMTCRTFDAAHVDTEHIDASHIDTSHIDT